MSTDYFHGQEVVCIIELDEFQRFEMRFFGLGIPVKDVVYRVDEAMLCPRCGLHALITLQEIGKDDFFPASWFRPVKRSTIEDLHGLLTPNGGMPMKTPELEDA